MRRIIKAAGLALVAFGLTAGPASASERTVQVYACEGQIVTNVYGYPNATVKLFADGQLVDRQRTWRGRYNMLAILSGETRWKLVVNPVRGKTIVKRGVVQTSCR